MEAASVASASTGRRANASPQTASDHPERWTGASVPG